MLGLLSIQPLCIVCVRWRESIHPPQTKTCYTGHACDDDPLAKGTHNHTRTHASAIRVWSLWEYEIPAEKLRGQKALEVVVKATDTSYNVQPERIEPYWNLVRGVWGESE